MLHEVGNTFTNKNKPMKIRKFERVVEEKKWLKVQPLIVKILYYLCIVQVKIVLDENWKIYPKDMWYDKKVRFLNPWNPLSYIVMIVFFIFFMVTDGDDLTTSEVKDWFKF